MSLSYFAESNAGVEQLWVSDGTVAVTHMVKAFAVHPINSLTAIGARVYFTVNGNVISQSVTPSLGALPIAPDASWSTQAKPTIR